MAVTGWRCSAFQAICQWTLHRRMRGIPVRTPCKQRAPGVSGRSTWPYCRRTYIEIAVRAVYQFYPV